MKKQEHMNRMWWMASAVVLLFVVTAVMPVAGEYDKAQEMSLCSHPAVV
ncbi:hypothetical protein [Methanoregula sp.]|nr:hypothetical protein [Methanoregula sp.]MDD5143762.1 hypothetical protein [Methanoregula sp.]